MQVLHDSNTHFAGQQQQQQQQQQGGWAPLASQRPTASSSSSCTGPSASRRPHATAFQPVPQQQQQASTMNTFQQQPPQVSPSSAPTTTDTAGTGEELRIAVPRSSGSTNSPINNNPRSAAFPHHHHQQQEQLQHQEQQQQQQQGEANASSSASSPYIPESSTTAEEMVQRLDSVYTQLMEQAQSVRQLREIFASEGAEYPVALRVNTLTSQIIPLYTEAEGTLNRIVKEEHKVVRPQPPVVVAPPPQQQQQQQQQQVAVVESENVVGVPTKRALAVPVATATTTAPAPMMMAMDNNNTENTASGIAVPQRGNKRYVRASQVVQQQTDSQVQAQEMSTEHLPRLPRGQAHHFCVVEFKSRRMKRYPCESDITIGNYVICYGDKGEDCGLVVMTGYCDEIGNFDNIVIFQDMNLDINRIRNVSDIYIFRLATQQEIDTLHGQLASYEANALLKCQEMASMRGLNMKFTDCEIQFDRQKFTFYFHAPESVDFRDLTRDLHRVFHARIWLENINSNVKNVVPEGALSQADKKVYAARGVKMQYR